MKNGFIYFLVASLMLSYNTIGNQNNYEEISSIEYLLNERVEIINGFLYENKNDKGAYEIKTLKNNLNEIEADDLLANDLEILNKVIENPSDYEHISNVKVDKIYSLNKYDGELSINADLNWNMSGYDGEFSMVKNYDIKCTQINDKIILTDLNIIE